MSDRLTPTPAPAVADQVPERPGTTPGGVSAKTLLARLPLYEQIAEDLRAQIESGHLAPGAPLPSETVLIERYHVSRITARAAVRSLRAAGLVITEHGRGTRVRDASTGPIDLDTAITHDPASHRLTTWDDAWSPVEDAIRYRTTATGPLARTLALDDGEPLFAHERLLTPANDAPAVGAPRIAHTVFVPFAVCVDAPGIEADPFAPLPALYAALTAVGHALTWHDTITARMPTPDEAAALTLSEGAPLLLHTRTTHGTDHRPLLHEHTRLDPHRITLTATTGPQL